MAAQLDSVVRENLSNYDTDWSLTEYTRIEGLTPLEAALIDEFFPRAPAKVLDLGCGAGRTTIGLDRLGYQTIAVDLAPTLLDQARLRFPTLDFRCMDATQLQFDDESFDAVLFSYNGIDCIYPADLRVRCMAEAHRVLKPGGVFLLSSHNVIGAIFSGGYFYLRGYLNAVKMLAMQWNNPLCFQWFFKYSDGGGSQRLFSAPPNRTSRQLDEVGFEVVDVRGMTGQRDPKQVQMHQQHVHFTARKRSC